jgi:hypothetical protein
MKKYLICLTALICLSGCSSLDKVFVNAVDASYVDVIHSRYVDYITNDPTIDVSTKLIRAKTAHDLKDLIEQAKKKLDKD